MNRESPFLRRVPVQVPAHRYQLPFVATLALLPALLVGCSDERPELPPLGSTRVGWELDPAAEELVSVGAAAVSPTGDLALTQVQDSRVVVYDSVGTRKVTLGREGEGPGEFRRLRGLVGWLADTLWVSEISSGKVTYFTLGTDSVWVTPGVRTVEPPDGGGPSASPAFLQAILSRQSRIYGVTLEETRPPPGWLGIREPLGGTVLVSTSEAGAFVRRLAIIPENATSCQLAVGRGAISLPFCPRPIWRVAGDGSRIAIVTPLASRGDRAAFHLLILDGASGDTLHSAEHSVPAARIIGSVADSVRRALASLPGPPEMQAAYASIEFPTIFPPVNRVRLGSDHTVWLQIGSPLASESIWLALDERGRGLRTFRFPHHVELIAFSSLGLWGLVESDGGAVAPIRFEISGMGDF